MVRIIKKEKRVTETLLTRHLSRIHCGVRKHTRGEEVTYNFTVHFRRKYDTVLLQSCWYSNPVRCVLDCFSLLEPLDVEINANWQVIHDELVVSKYLINEINSIYLSKIVAREIELERAFLPPFVSNGRVGLARALKKRAMTKAQVSRINRLEHGENFRTWEEFDFEFI